MDRSAALAHVKHDESAMIFENVRKLLPEIAARSEEIDRTAKVPRDLLDKIEEAGAFRMGLPVEFGGAAMSLRQICDITEMVSGADAAVGWQLMTALGAHSGTARLPYKTLAKFYAAGPNTWSKSSYTPKGMAEPVEGGYRLSGRWAFASGAREFEWISVGFMVRDGAGVKMMPDGRPDIRVCILPKDQVTMVNTWHVVGMRGTQSDDIEVKDVFVPDDWQGQFFGPINIDAPALRGGIPGPTTPVHTAVMMGILKAAVADLAEIAAVRRPASNPAILMKDDPAFLQNFGKLLARVDSLDALYNNGVDLGDHLTLNNIEATPLQVAKINGGGTFVNHEATQVMDEIMMYAGSNAIYNHQAQQRRWRNLRTAAQHQAANLGNYGRYAGHVIP